MSATRIAEGAWLPRTATIELVAEVQPHATAFDVPGPAAAISLVGMSVSKGR
jgi:hypothetical protein